MIFVTVGTHEQPFDRLVKCIDDLKGKGAIQEQVIIQTGYSTYEPKNCTWSKLLPLSEMERNVAAARIVITHGGPSSFITPLSIGKIPLVVPRQKQFGEHVNDHQVDFVKAVAERMGTIIPIFDTAQLEEAIRNYDETVESMPSGLNSNNAAFCRWLEELANELMGKQR